METSSQIGKDHSYINKLPTFADRGQAIAKRLEAVKSDPSYLALPKERQDKIRADIYHKYVPTSYSGFHLAVPDEKTWVEATGRDTTFHTRDDNFKKEDTKFSDSFKEGTDKSRRQDFANSGMRAIHQVDLFGTKVANRAFMAMFGLHEHFTHENSLSDLIVPGSSEAADYEKFKKNAIVRVVQNHKDALEQNIQTSNFWLQTHPRNTIIGNLANNLGETIATLPLYEAIGAVGIPGKVAKYVPMGSLTTKLMQTPVGKWVGKRLVEATDGYLSTLVVSGGDKKEAAIGGAAFAGVGAAGEGIAKVLKIAAAPLIKKWTANTIAMGGKPFAQEIANSAMAEEEQEIAHEGEGIAHIKRVESIRSFIADTTQKAEARAERETELGKLGALQEERANKIKAWKERQEQRARLDPVMDKLHKGEKVSLNSLAVATYQKPLNQLSKNQRSLVLAKRMELIDQAAQEAPVHLPDLHKDEVEHNIQAARKENPLMNSLMSDFEKLGVKFADAVTDNSAADISRETGISNVKGAAKKVKKAAEYTPGAHPEYDEMSRTVGSDGLTNLERATKRSKTDSSRPPEGFLPHTETEKNSIEAMLGRPYNENTDSHYMRRSYNVGKKENLAPVKFASLNSASSVSLRAPRNRTQFMDAISDRSKAGANKFIDLLKTHIPANIHFEDPAHMMLFFYGNRKELVKTKEGEAIVRTLRDRLRQTKGWEGVDAKQLDTSAKYLHNHLYDMAKSGHLVSEGNIYRSTQLSGPLSWTKWQAPLSNEADQETIALTEKALKNHPQAARTFKTLVKTLQKARGTYQTPEEYAEYKRVLADSSHTILSHATTGDAIIFGK